MKLDMRPDDLREAVSQLIASVDAGYDDIAEVQAAVRAALGGLQSSLRCSAVAVRFIGEAEAASARLGEQVRDVADRLTADAKAVDEFDSDVANQVSMICSHFGYQPAPTGPVKRVVADSESLSEAASGPIREAQGMSADRQRFFGSMTDRGSGWEGLTAAVGNTRAKQVTAALDRHDLSLRAAGKAICDAVDSLAELDARLSKW